MFQRFTSEASCLAQYNKHSAITSSGGANRHVPAAGREAGQVSRIPEGTKAVTSIPAPSETLWRLEIQKLFSEPLLPAENGACSLICLYVLFGRSRGGAAECHVEWGWGGASPRTAKIPSLRHVFHKRPSRLASAPASSLGECSPTGCVRGPVRCPVGSWQAPIPP